MLSRKYNLNQQQDTITCLLEWLKSKTLETWNNSEDVEQKEPSFITNGNAKWYSHFGRQFSSILQNYTYLFHVIQQRSWNLMSAQNAEHSVYQFSSVQSFSRVWLFATPCSHARPPCLTNSPVLFKLMSIELVMPSNHLFLCHPLLPPSIFPNIRVFFK